MALVFQPLTKDKGIFTADFGNASLQNKDKRGWKEKECFVKV